MVPPVRSMVRVFDPVERAEVALAAAVGGARLDVGQALPAATDAEDVVAGLGRSIDDALDDGVEAGDVAAAGQDGDAFRSRHGAGILLRVRPRPFGCDPVPVRHRTLSGGAEAVC